MHVLCIEAVGAEVIHGGAARLSARIVGTDAEFVRLGANCILAFHLMVQDSVNLFSQEDGEARFHYNDRVWFWTRKKAVACYVVLTTCLPYLRASCIPSISP